MSAERDDDRPRASSRDDPRRRTIVRAAWTLAFALVAILLLKVFVCDVYHVDSGSMEPTILGSPQDGESVLVLYGGAQPERFDIVVLRRDGEPAPLVKRVAGLPRETVQIAGGDLLVDGARLPPAAPRPPPVLLLEERGQASDEWFDADAPWKRRGDEWTVDAAAFPAGSPAPALKLHKGLRDDYIKSDGSVEPGDQQVNDAIVECEVWSVPEGRVVVELVEQGDTFRFSVGNDDARIERVSAGSPVEVLASAEAISLEAMAWMRLCCSNVDNNLCFSGDRFVLQCAYAENRFDPADRLKEGKSFGPRVRIVAEGGIQRVRAIRISRDLYWTARGAHGVDSPQDLGPDECFVLGDNSARSRDSREWGPVRLDQILGRPVWVVWPPSRIRRLEPRVPPPSLR